MGRTEIERWVRTEEPTGDFQTSSVRRVANWPDCNVELGDEDQADDNHTEPGTINATESPVRELVNVVTLNLPCPAEPDVAQEDGAPAEEC